MTFGEHLEELRGALFRALAGLLVGFLIALMFAPTVVRGIEWPLKKALRRHYLATAKLDLSTSDRTNQASADWAAVDRLGLIPSQVYVDADRLRALSGDEQPNISAKGRSKGFFYQYQDIPQGQCGDLAQQILRRSQGQRNRPEKAIWQSLSDPGRQSIERLAGSETATRSDQQDLADCLNEVIADPSFSQSSALSLSGFVSDDSYRELLEAERSAIDGSSESRQSQSLNRQLLDAMLAKHVRGYRPQLTELTIWEPIEIRVQALSVHEPFMIYIKAAIVVGFILSSPWVFYQIWQFVAAGLYAHERRFVYRFLPFSIGLFLLGTALAFCFVFEPVLDFLFSFNRQLNINAQPRITDWISFVLLLPVGFGLSFQLPLVMLFLERIGVFTVENYLAQWKIAVLIVFVLSMFLTPADPMSMLLMAVPLTVLYFGGIGLCRYFPAELARDKSSETSLVDVQS